jgi:O-antigen/teichoic acid export membrane protein
LPILPKQANISRNAVFSVLSWVLPLGLSFIATPVIVHGLGKKQYGIYALVLGFLSYSFAFGIGRAITKYVAEFHATNEKEKVVEVISSTILINCAVGIAGVLILTIFAKWFVVSVLLVEDAMVSEAVTAFYFASLVIFATMLSQAFSAVLQAVHRFDIFSVVTVSANSLLAVGNIVLALSGYGIQGLLTWNLVVLILSTIVYIYFAKKLLSGFRLTFRVSGSMFRLVMRYCAAIVSMQIFANIFLLFERSWITRKYGAEALTYYVIPMNLALMVHAFISSLVIVIFPFASESRATGDHARLLGVYQKASKIVLAVVAFLMLTLIVNGDFLLRRWVGAEFAQNSTGVLMYHVLTFGLLAVATISWQVIEGVGRPQFTTRLTFLWLIISGPLMFVFSSSYSVTSMAAARFIGSLIIMPAVLIIEKFVFGNILLKFWRAHLALVGLAACLAVLIQIGALYTLTPSIPVLMADVCLSAAIYFLLLIQTSFFTEDEKAWAVALFRRARPHREP